MTEISKQDTVKLTFVLSRRSYLRTRSANSSHHICLPRLLWRMNVLPIKATRRFTSTVVERRIIEILYVLIKSTLRATWSCEECRWFGEVSREGAQELQAVEGRLRGGRAPKEQTRKRKRSQALLFYLFEHCGGSQMLLPPLCEVTVDEDRRATAHEP